MSTDRDTHFGGFAELLLAKIADSDGWMLSDVEKLVAQWAYDLACHVATETILIAHGDMGKISDLTEWPKGQE